jgi:hypothetical protein
VTETEGTDWTFVAHALAPALRFLPWPVQRLSHLGIEVEQLLQPLGVVLEAATDVDALQHFVIALMRRAQVSGHGLGVIEVGNGRREMMLPRQQDVLAQRVRSSLFFSVSVGTGKVFQPRVLEYEKSVFILPQTCRSRPGANAMR